MLTVENRHAVHPAAAKAMDTKALRENFLGSGLFRTGEIRLIYTHYDRMIVGGAVPGGNPLTLDRVAEAGTNSILDRREMGIVNIGGPGRVRAGDQVWDMARGDVLYLPMGAGAVTFEGEGRFFIASSPAHAAHPARLIRLADAKKLELGTSETANKRTINQFIHPLVMPSCQLVLGYTQFHAGSVWNTMPCHTHDRRMEAYLYFDMDENTRVLHLMGEPSETRHLVVANEEAAISPPWSIHSGCGTGGYSFIWCMAGDNVDYTDMDMVAMGDLK
ncbi:MAG: 5-dehydro-4-deoxy-D-glucuronate isomerase [Pseudorhodobacter sp.]